MAGFHLDQPLLSFRILRFSDVWIIGSRGELTHRSDGYHKEGYYRVPVVKSVFTSIYMPRLPCPQHFLLRASCGFAPHPRHTFASDSLSFVCSDPSP